MGLSDIVARLLFGYWTVVGIINLCFVTGFGLDGVAEMLVFLAIGVASWIVVNFLTEKVMWVVAKTRRKTRTGGHSAWRS